MLGARWDDVEYLQYYLLRRHLRFFAGDAAHGLECRGPFVKGGANGSRGKRDLQPGLRRVEIGLVHTAQEAEDAVDQVAHDLVRVAEEVVRSAGDEAAVALVDDSAAALDRLAPPLHQGLLVDVRGHVRVAAAEEEQQRRAAPSDAPERRREPLVRQIAAEVVVFALVAVRTREAQPTAR